MRGWKVDEDIRLDTDGRYGYNGYTDYPSCCIFDNDIGLIDAAQCPSGQPRAAPQRGAGAPSPANAASPNQPVAAGKEGRKLQQTFTDASTASYDNMDTSANTASYGSYDNEDHYSGSYRIGRATVFW